MKKIFLGVLLMAGFALSSRAQKRSVLVYGIMGIHTEKEPNDDKTTEFSIHPGVGYQFSDHWMAGIAGAYGHEKFEPGDGDKNISNNYRAGGFARYTHGFNEIFSLFGQGDVYYLNKKVEEVKSHGFGVALVPTVGINISNGFLLNISFGGISFETIKIKDADNSTKTFDMNFGQEIQIGFSKKIGGKK